jgi:hypothetical protein
VSAQPRGAAHLQHDEREQALFLVDRSAGERQALHLEARSGDGRGAPPPLRDQAKTALADVQAKSGDSAAGFEKWLAGTLERKRDERRRAVLSNMAGKTLPALVLTDLQDNRIDLRAQRGNVILLNFFSAW